jgi:predicted dehydrogenase
MEAVVRFRGDAVGSHTQSMAAAAEKPMIRICGTKGAMLATHNSVVIHTVDKRGNRIATTVPMEKGDQGRYYANVGDHVLRGKPLIITAELARRVIQVLDYASRSAQQHKALKPKYS